jgi:hypothetical protein
MFIDTTRPIVRVEPKGARSFSGLTTAVTRAVNDPSRGIQTTATMSFGKLKLLPIELTSAENEGGSGTPDRAVVIIEDFEASIDCNSTASGSANAAYDWSATLRYLKDKQRGDGKVGKYTSISISSSNTTDPLAGIRGANNPLVVEGAFPDEDFYLFDDPAGGKQGYLSQLDVAHAGTVNAALTSSVDATGRETAAGIDGAISIVTAAVDPDMPSTSSIKVEIGKLTCNASDQR